MGILAKPKHEEFAQLVARGESGGQAYVAAYGACKGADQSAARLLRNAQVLSRIGELRQVICSKLLDATLRERNFRLERLQKRHDLLEQVIAERARMFGATTMYGAPRPAEGAEGHEIESAPGASTGLLCLDWRGKDAVQAVWKVDTGLLAELRAIEEQVAREVGELEGGGGTGGAAVQVNVVFVSPPAAG